MTTIFFRRKATEQSTSVRHASTKNVTPVQPDRFCPVGEAKGPSFLYFARTAEISTWVPEVYTNKNAAPPVYFPRTESRTVLEHSCTSLKTRLKLTILRESGVYPNHMSFKEHHMEVHTSPLPVPQGLTLVPCFVLFFPRGDIWSSCFLFASFVGYAFFYGFASSFPRAAASHSKPKRYSTYDGFSGLKYVTLGPSTTHSTVPVSKRGP